MGIRKIFSTRKPSPGLYRSQGMRKSTPWMHYNRGENVKRDDNKQYGYLSHYDAKLDAAELQRNHPENEIKIYTVDGVVNGRNVSWYIIIYKTITRVKAKKPSDWIIDFMVEDIKSKQAFPVSEIVSATSKAEIVDYIKKSKYGTSKKYKILVKTMKVKPYREY